MDESKILKSFAKILGPDAEKTLNEIELKKQKQSQMLKGMAKLLGTEVLLEEIQTKEAIERQVIEEKKEKEKKLLETLSNSLNNLIENNPQHVELIEQEIIEVLELPVSDSEEKIVELVDITEDLQPMPELPKDNIVTPGVEFLSKVAQKDIQKAANLIPDSLRKELDIIKKSIADFHRFAQRHSQMGGGGAGDVVNLDHPTSLINVPTYNVNRKDYYLGVNYAGPVTIYLPSISKNGRQLIIKDESGLCSINPITVDGNVDNDTNGFILAENNGGIQMIFHNNGWRII